jgi:lipopolysaccharide export system protein LptC
MAAAVPHRQFQRLARRNRTVSVLRVLVPLGGMLVLAVLGIQIVLSTFTSRFGIDRITISPEAITVDAPEYSGILQDGSAYRVSADTARASTSRTDIIDLNNASLVLNRQDGVQFQADAAEAQLDSTQQLVMVEGVADIADTRGMTGTLTSSVFDWDAQMLTTEGPVVINQADGTTVVAEGLVYDASAVIWTFTRSVVTLPSTPGENTTSSSSGDTDQ